MNVRTIPDDHVQVPRHGGGWALLVEAALDLRMTGAIAPSGKALARAVTDRIWLAPRPLSVLEVGAGTGAITQALIPRLPPDSRLDVVEANPRLATLLWRLVNTCPDLAGSPTRVTVHQTFLEDFSTDERYDVIVSGLPLTNLAPSRVEQIMSRYMELLSPGGTLTLIGYLGSRRGRTRAGRRQRAAADDILADYRRRYATRRWTVWANLRSAHVWRLQRPFLPVAPSSDGGMR
ncbi:methyltransferase [Streptomyces sp. NPDC005483]|uniref:class I SAM-dependent methyltransferase n=1 Tax=Streptomyces sp. NPDC005483 TaxID=3154882 RepID=UPI0033A5AA0B